MVVVVDSVVVDDSSVDVVPIVVEVDVEVDSVLDVEVELASEVEVVVAPVVVEWAGREPAISSR